MDEEPRHAIQLVARRTGLSPETIRAWERRYSAIRPSRSPTKRRLYSDVEVERLLLLRRATLAGRRIGSIARLPTTELETLIREDEAASARVPEPPRTQGDLRESRALSEACLDAVVALDPAHLDLALRRAAMDLACSELLEQVVAPLLRRLGSRWREGTLRIAHEHLATARVRSLLETLRASGPHPAVGPQVVVATPAGQRHELGALMVAVTAGIGGWRTVYLGADLPADEIAAAAEVSRARAVALSIVHPADDPALGTELDRLRDLLPSGTELLVGGRAAASYSGVLGHANARVLGNLASLRDELDRIRANAA